MSGVHASVGAVLLAVNALAAIWGGVAWLRRRPSVAFWYVLRAAQATVVAQALVGVVLLAQGRRAEDDLHLLYGIAPLVVMLVSETMRLGAVGRETAGVADLDSLDHAQQVALARRVVLREMGVMTTGTLLIVTLALRAASTSGGLL